MSLFFNQEIVLPEWHTASTSMIRIHPLKKLFRSSIALVLVFSLTENYCRADDSITLPPGTDFSILPPPPTDDSPAGLADLDVVLYAQANRTQDQAAFAKKMESATVFDMDQSIFGPWFTRENLPKTAAILKQVAQLTNKIKEEAKDNWKRPRPYMRSALVNPVVNKPGDVGCYPSGHSFGMAIPEFILSAAFPEHAAQFDAMTHEVMWGRIVGGVHYPSDTEAGRLLAKDVVDKMLKTPGMQEALVTIRQEVAPFLTNNTEGALAPQ